MKKYRQFMIFYAQPIDDILWLFHKLLCDCVAVSPVCSSICYNLAGREGCPDERTHHPPGHEAFIQRSIR